jgi:ribosome-binding factor A
MADRRRVKRLEALILQTVAPLVSHGLSDPRLAMVTVTRVKLAADLSVARVNWSTLGGPGDVVKVQRALEHARGPLQAAVAAALRTRVTPRLAFHYDESLVRGQRVTEVLEQLSRERAEREGATAAPAEPEPPDEDEA